MDPLIPLTVIAGYLGAGKTTLLNHLLTAEHGRRIAVIVNDFGALAIDADLIASHDGDTYALTNGCVCCSIGDDLGSTLLEIAELADPPEAIFFEASGVAEPARFGAYSNRHHGTELRGVVVVVDVETVRARVEDPYVGDLLVRQLVAADVIVLNKVDLVDAERLDEIRRWLPTLGAPAVTVAADHGVVPDELWSDDPTTGLLGAGDAGPPEPPPAIGVDLPTAADRFVSTAVVDVEPWDRRRLTEAVDRLPTSIVRAKGTVVLADEAEPHLFQLVGRRWSLTPAPPDRRPAGRRSTTELVLIAVDPTTAVVDIGRRLAAEARSEVVQRGGRT